ncbi:MAG: hypothetical protein L0H59_17155, partial [Tomitella sp.]|nr:hypothetical protein [Tomitella sp.]
MSEAPNITEAIPTLNYGYARARLIRGWTDGPDVDRAPDPKPATDLTITLSPATPDKRIDQDGYFTFVSSESLTCKVDAQGYLIDEQETRDVSLYTGWWSVKFASATGKRVPAAFNAEITTAHTAAAPLDLLDYLTPGGPILTVSEYEELKSDLGALDSRVTTLEAGGGGTGGADGRGIVSVTDTDGDGVATVTYTDATTDSLPLPAGADGADSTVPGPEGDSAYEVAVTNGYVGTEAEWLTSLEGTDGADGVGIPQTLSLTGSDLTLSDGGGTVTLPSGGGAGAVTPIGVTTPPGWSFPLTMAINGSGAPSPNQGVEYA